MQLEKKQSKNNFSAKLSKQALAALQGVPPGYKSKFVSVAIELIVPLIKDECTIQILNEPELLKEFLAKKLGAPLGGSVATAKTVQSFGHGNAKITTKDLKGIF